MKYVLLISTWVLAFTTFSQDFKKMDKLEACKKALQEKHKQLKTLKADFEEISNNSMLNETQKSTGVFYFQKDDKIRWENKSPKQRAILISGKNVKLYEDSKEVKNATTKMVVKRVQDLMLNMLGGDFLNETEFSITYYENSSSYKLVLVPKTAKLKKYVSKMELIFNKTSLLLQELKMISIDDDKVTYKFTNVKPNITIAETVFTKL